MIFVPWYVVFAAVQNELRCGSWSGNEKRDSCVCEPLIEECACFQRPLPPQWPVVCGMCGCMHVLVEAWYEHGYKQGNASVKRGKLSIEFVLVIQYYKIY